MSLLIYQNKGVSFFAFALFILLSLKVAFTAKGKSHSKDLLPVQFYFSSAGERTRELSLDFLKELKETNGQRYVELNKTISAINKKLGLLLLSISLEAEKFHTQRLCSSKEKKCIPDPDAMNERYRRQYDAFRLGDLDFLKEFVRNKMKMELNNNNNLLYPFLEPKSLFVKKIWQSRLDQVYFLNNDKQNSATPSKKSKLMYFHYKVNKGKLTIEFRPLLSPSTMNALKFGTHIDKLLEPQRSTSLWFSLLYFFEGIENLQVLNIHKGVMFNTLDYFPTRFNVKPDPKYTMLTPSSPFNYDEFVHKSSLMEPEPRTFLDQFTTTTEVFGYKPELQNKLKQAKEKLMNSLKDCERIQALGLKTSWREGLAHLVKGKTYEFFYVLNTLYKFIQQHSSIHWKPFLNSFSPLHQYFSFKSAAVLFSTHIVQNSGLISASNYGDLNFGIKIKRVESHRFNLLYISSFKKQQDYICPSGSIPTECITMISFFKDLDGFLHSYYLYSLADIVDNEMRIAKFFQMKKKDSDKKESDSSNTL